MEARIGLIKNGLKNLEEGPVKNKKQRVEMMKNAMNLNTFIAPLIKKAQMCRLFLFREGREDF